MLHLPLISYLLKMGIRQLPCKVKTRFPSQVIDLQCAAQSWKHRCTKPKRYQRDVFAISHVPNQTHNNFTVTHGWVLASCWNWPFLLLGCQCSYSNSRAFPWPLCNTGNVDLCSFDSRVKHFLHSVGSAAAHAVLSVSPQLFQSEQKCLEEQGETCGLGGSVKKTGVRWLIGEMTRQNLSNHHSADRPCRQQAVLMHASLC